MSLVWLATSFCYYLILMLADTFKDVYLTGLTNGLAEIIAYFINGFIYDRLGIKPTLMISFSIATIGGLLILIWGLDNQGSPLFFIFFLLSKFGITSNWTVNYAAMDYLFPTLFRATAIGVCSFLARGFSSISFLVGGLDEPTPMIIFTTACGSMIFASLFLRTEKKAEVVV